MSSTLNEMGYTRTKADHTVFVCPSPDITPDIITLYVDDMGQISESLERILQDKAKLSKHYQMTDLGEVSWILGIRVDCNREKGTIALSQGNFIKEILECYGMSDSHLISTPALTNEHLVKLELPEISAKSYQRALGTLIYPMLGTHPDLSYTIATLGHHAANPGLDHQRALECVFHYLRATNGKQLVFGQGASSGSTLFGYADADWASDVNDRKSTSGYIFKLAGAAVSWSSKKQTSIALSSTEVEYITGVHAAKEAIWLRQLLSELGLDMSSPTALHIDNQLAIAITRNPEFHDHTKHINVCYYFLRQVVEDKSIKLEYIPTGDQVADALTKGLPPASYSKSREEMGIRYSN
jgi:hypothetical protein